MLFYLTWTFVIGYVDFMSFCYWLCWLYKHLLSFKLKICTLFACKFFLQNFTKHLIYWIFYLQKIHTDDLKNQFIQKGYTWKSMASSPWPISSLRGNIYYQLSSAGIFICVQVCVYLMLFDKSSSFSYKKEKNQTLLKCMH